MDKYFQLIEEAAAEARADHRPVCRMVVLKFLTKPIFDQCKYLLTRMDHGILNVIWPVILDQSRSVEDRLKQSGTFFEEAGIVLPDYESYVVFSAIVLPVVKYLNGMDPKQPILPHPPTEFFEDVEEEVSSVGTTVTVLSKMELRNDEAAQRNMDLDPSRKMILHSVAHCTRNLQDFNLPMCLTLDELRQVERFLRRALLTGKSPYETKDEKSGYEYDDLVLSDDEGTYYPLEELSDPLHDVRARLRSAGQWLEQQGDPDRSMRLHGKYWPIGRGVFVTRDGSIAAYINVQDHLRVMVAAKEGQAGKIGLVYRKIGEFMNKLDRIFKFKRDDILGHLSSRPWACGNTLRFKVTVRLPKLGREPEHLIALCKSRSLRLASAASLDVFHFSNRQCLSITESQTYRSFVTAVANILQLEHRMEANGLHFTAILGKLFRRRHLAEANAARS